MGRVRWAALGLLLVLVLGAGVGAAAAWSQGYRLYAVRTGSMAPAFPTGALVVDAPPTGAAAVGSVITFRVGEGLVTHRVHGTSTAGVTTKGDANATPDAWTIPARAIVGHVIAAIPRGGYVLVFFKQPTGSIALASGILSAVLLWRLFFPADDDASAAETSHRSASDIAAR